MNADEDAEHIDDQDKAPWDDNPTKVIGMERKKNSDFENLDIIKTTLRSLNVPISVNSSSVYHCLSPISGLELKSNKQEVIGVGDESSRLEGVVLNENNTVLLL